MNTVTGKPATFSVLATAPMIAHCRGVPCTVP